MENAKEDPSHKLADLESNPDLTSQAATFIDEQGFVVIENFLNEEDIRALRQRAQEMIFENEEESALFTTTNQLKMNKKLSHFLDSGSRTSLFWEEDACDEEGKLISEKATSINKIGHAMHDLDSVFKRISYSEATKFVVKNIFRMRSPLLIQSMYIFKQPKIGGEVKPHQDSTFLYSNPLTCKALWIALEDATTLNGCLWGVPGSHRSQPLTKKFVVDSETGTLKFKDFNGEDTTPPTFDLNGAVKLEVKAGTLIAFDGSFVHFSESNTSEKSREAMTLHFIESDSDWPADNWLQRPKEMPFKGFDNY